MKTEYNESEIISTLEFVNDKVNQYLRLVKDDNLDYWELDKNKEGDNCIRIQTSTSFWGDMNYRSHYVFFEVLLSTSEEQVKLIEKVRKKEEELKKFKLIERQLELDRERERRDYEEYLKLKKKYENDNN